MIFLEVTDQVASFFICQRKGEKHGENQRRF